MYMQKKITMDCSKIQNDKIEYCYVDYFKLIFAIIIVLHHTVQRYESSSVIVDIINLATQIAVPYYFVASAFFLFKDKLSKQRISRYIKRILGLYFFWTTTLLPFRIPDIINSGFDLKTNMIYFLKYVTIIIFIGEYQLWYLIGTIWALSMILILGKIQCGKKIMITITAAMFILMQLINLKLLPDNILINGLLKIYWIIFGTTRNGIFVGFIYMSIGMYIGKFKKLQKLDSNILNLMMVGVIVLEIMVYNFCVDIQSWFIPVIVIVLFLFSINIKTNKVDGLEKIARSYSMLLYVSHMTILNTTLIICKFDVISECIIVLVATFVFSWIIFMLSKKIKWLKMVY